MYPNISFSISSFSISPSKTPPGSPQTPRSNASPGSTATVHINNRAIEVPERLKADVCNAVDCIRSDYFNALSLSKELVLNPDVLIPLLNHAKLYWHTWLSKTPCETSASERIENVFINNKNLSKEESDWVAETIVDYKRMVKCAVAQNAPRPITPPPSIISLPLNKKCPCNML